MDIHVARPFPPLFPRHQIDLSDISDEVRVEDAAVVFGVVFPRLAKEILFGRVESVLEQVAGVEDKLRVAVKLEGNRCAGQGHVSRRLAPAGVKMLMPGVQRNGEDASPFPLESPLRVAVIPNRRCASAGGDQNNLFIELPLRS